MQQHYLLIFTLIAAVAASASQSSMPAAASEPSSQAANASGPPAETNPFFAESALPFHAPPFDKIRDADYQPALEEGMKRQLVEVEAIADSAGPPTFANTIEAMERSGALLTRVSHVFFCLTQADTNPTLQKVESEESPKLAAHLDQIYLNPKLFARVKSVYERRDSPKPLLDAESKYLVERYYKTFVRAGALLSEADKTKLRALNQEEAKLTTDFRARVLADTNASAVVVDDKAQLEGLSDGDIAAAADLAKERGLQGKYVIALQNTTRQPIVISMKNRALRERVLKASTERGSHGGANDTRALVTRLAQLRAEKAKLLGFTTYAAYSLDDQMAKTPQQAAKLMTDLVPAATAKARDEAAKLQRVADAEGGNFKIGPADWEYYAEKVRKAEYDLDDSQIKPYFELDRVLRDGVFFAAHQLYGLTFKERKDIPVYNPDVRVFEVTDADGAPLALFYADYFQRPSKSGGAWMDVFVDQSTLTGAKPVVYNIANFQKPSAGQPALISFEDVTTMFHEFGHALHGMFSHVKYPTLSGTNVPRDFVEFPSQFNEHWALEPSVFANYAKHYQTGEPMPQSLVEKIRRAHTFNQGYDTTEYLSAALLDLAWHTLPADAPVQDAGVFEPAALKRFGVELPQVPPRYHTTYFSHIWGGGYSAGYYAYLWSEVLDHDAFYWFKEHGGLTRENGQHFRDMVLSRGGTEDSAALYRAFRGRDPQVEPLLIERGLKQTKE
ncbi:MAG TPA: peptidyl-dipeptidase Dcp [Pyrinomonadaceae bacterium]|jgi:peptidyl-dipeptidase Dcp|nr:peptidyl-dipeptidase Dcp [Pyrinomonadaceae bacterium]